MLALMTATKQKKGDETSRAVGTQTVRGRVQADRRIERAGVGMQAGQEGQQSKQSGGDASR
jgi:hypothetical protein